MWTLPARWGPCSVTVNDDDTVTVMGTIHTADYTPPAANPLASLDAEAVAGAIGMNDAIVAFTDNSIFEVAGGKVTKQDNDGDNDEFAKSDASPAAIDDWAGAIYTRTTNEDDEDTADMDETVTEMVVSYTNVEDPTDEAYTDYFSSALAGSRDGVESLDGTDASVLNIDETEVAANHMRFVGDFGITGAHQTIPAPVDDPVTTGDDMDEAMVSVMGSFYGIPGEFKCASQCTRSSDKDGNLSGLGGDWTFTATVADDEELADIMVAGVVDDTDYLDFGYWIVTSQGEDGPMYTVGIFQDGMQEHSGGVDGKAEYAGPATGVYMTKTFDPGTGDPIPVSGGQFTAHAMLTAYFGADTEVPSADHNRISGTISDFYNSDGEMIDDEWEVELMRAVINGGVFNVSVTSTGEGSDPGAWGGRFYGPPNDGAETDPQAVMPDSVAGTFNAHFSNGHAAGAFGATIVEEDE